VKNAAFALSAGSIAKPRSAAILVRKTLLLHAHAICRIASETTFLLEQTVVFELALHAGVSNSAWKLRVNTKCFVHLAK
jgi:hypothetical protein